MVATEEEKPVFFDDDGDKCSDNGVSWSELFPVLNSDLPVPDDNVVPLVGVAVSVVVVVEAQLLLLQPPEDNVVGLDNDGDCSLERCECE